MPLRRRVADDTRRVLRNVEPTYDLGWVGEFSVLEALDPGGKAGDHGWGGATVVPDGKVLALRSITGQMAGQHTQPTFMQGFRMFLRNVAQGATPLQSILRGLEIVTSLAGNGHCRTIYARADAEPGATGFHNAITAATSSAPGSNGVAYTAASEGTAGRNIGINLESQQANHVPWGTGIRCGPAVHQQAYYLTEFGVSRIPHYRGEVVPLTGAVQDTADFILPAGSLIKAVAVKAPTGIVVAAGDPGNPTRFLAGRDGGGIGLAHHAAGLVAQQLPGRVRLSVTGTPSGSATVVAFYERFFFEG